MKGIIWCICCSCVESQWNEQKTERGRTGLSTRREGLTSYRFFLCSPCVKIPQPAKKEKMPYPLYMKRVKAQKKKERRERRDVRRPLWSWLPFGSDALPSCLSAVSLGRDANPEKGGKTPEKVGNT